MIWLEVMGLWAGSLWWAHFLPSSWWHFRFSHVCLSAPLLTVAVSSSSRGAAPTEKNHLEPLKFSLIVKCLDVTLTDYWIIYIALHLFSCFCYLEHLSVDLIFTLGSVALIYSVEDKDNLSPPPKKTKKTLCFIYRKSASECTIKNKRVRTERRERLSAE